MIMFVALSMRASVPADVVSISEYEAEDQKTSGAEIGPDRQLGSIAAEASGRRAVFLGDWRRSIDINLKTPALGFTIRYALPDTADGTGQSSVAIIEAGGRQIASMALTSRYSVYYGAYPLPIIRRMGRPRHFWDEARLLLAQSLPAGTRLSIHPAAGLPGFAVDLAGAGNALASDPLRTSAEWSILQV